MKIFIFISGFIYGFGFVFSLTQIKEPFELISIIGAVTALFGFMSLFIFTYIKDQKNKKISSLQQQNNILVKKNEEIKNALGFSKKQKFEFEEIIKQLSSPYFSEEEKNFTFSQEKFFKDMGVFCPSDEINFGYGK